MSDFAVSSEENLYQCTPVFQEGAKTPMIENVPTPKEIVESLLARCSHSNARYSGHIRELEVVAQYFEMAARSSICGQAHELEELYEAFKGFFAGSLKQEGFDLREIQQLPLQMAAFLEMNGMFRVINLIKRIESLPEKLMGELEQSRHKTLKRAFVAIARDGVNTIQDLIREVPVERKEKEDLSRQHVRNLVLHMQRMRLVELVPGMSQAKNAAWVFRATELGKKVLSILNIPTEHERETADKGQRGDASRANPPVQPDTDTSVNKRHNSFLRPASNQGKTDDHARRFFPSPPEDPSDTTSGRTSTVKEAA